MPVVMTIGPPGTATAFTTDLSSTTMKSSPSDGYCVVEFAANFVPTHRT